MSARNLTEKLNLLYKTKKKQSSKHMANPFNLLDHVNEEPSCSSFESYTFSETSNNDDEFSIDELDELEEQIIQTKRSKVDIENQLRQLQQFLSMRTSLDPIKERIIFRKINKDINSADIVNFQEMRNRKKRQKDAQKTIDKSPLKR